MRVLPLFFIFVLAAQGCALQSTGPEQGGFHAGGRTGVHVSVGPPLSLAASGRFSVPTPSDVMTNSPYADFLFAAFSEDGSGPVRASAHVILSELPYPDWRWEMETWARPESLRYSKLTAARRNWTVQIFPLMAGGDWFSELWTLNNRQTPDFWLAKRWSATPDEELRIVAEYREAVPACMREQLQSYAESRKNKEFGSLNGRELAGRCEREMEEFSARADAAVRLDEDLSRPLDASGIKARLPDGRPNMRALVGVAEFIRTQRMGTR
ncbi:MAG: DUF4851 domain-containing protein [Desulfovibrio sp.]|jgi:hypothetical protein|nr:DUF4851 domain-containing protein [Desulfovibrio sp.]